VPQAANTVEGTLRFLRVFSSVLLFSVILYIWVAEKVVEHPPQLLNPVMLLGIGACSLAVFAIALFARVKIIRPALETLQTKQDDTSALQHWRSGNILSFVLFEAIVLFGFALRFLGGSTLQSLPFYAAGIGLMLLWWPHRP
jgi:hypothetical protein